MNSKEVGALGEKIARKYLKKQGYRILDKNYIRKASAGPYQGEIDIVAKKGSLISFIEVKSQILNPNTRLSPRGRALHQSKARCRVSPAPKQSFWCRISLPSPKLVEGAYPERVEGFSPEQRVNFQKQKKIIKTAQTWLMEKKIPLDTKWQVDVISISLNLHLRKAKVSHFKNILTG